MSLTKAIATMLNLGDNKLRKFKAYQSPLFKKIKSDSRNQGELARMIKNAGRNEDVVYSFFVDGEKKEMTIKTMSASVNFV